jgi:hypothetical protein
VQWTARQPVVTLPDHIDVPSADQIREAISHQPRRYPADHGYDRSTVVRPRRRGCGRACLPACHRRQGPRGGGRSDGPGRAIPGPMGRRRPALVCEHRARSGKPARGAGLELRSSHHGCWALADAIADGIALTGAEGVIELVNRRPADMFGYGYAPLIGQPVESLIPADLRGGPPQQPSRIRAGTCGPADVHGDTAGRAAQGPSHLPGRGQPQPGTGSSRPVHPRRGTEPHREPTARTSAAPAQSALLEQAHRSQQLLD